MHSFGFKQGISLSGIILLLILLIGPSSAALGPPSELWNRTFGNVAGNDEGYAVHAAPWCPVTIAGYYTHPVYGQSGIYYTYYPSGEYAAQGGEWSEVYYGVADVPWELGIADAAFLVAGERHYLDTSGRPTTMAVALKDPWQDPIKGFHLEYGGAPAFYDSGFRAIMNSFNPVQNDLFYAASGKIALSYGGQTDAYLVELGVGGGINWSHTYGGTTDDWVNGMDQTSEYGFILVGGTESADGDTDVFLQRTDPMGTGQGTWVYGGTGTDIGNGVLQTPDGGFLIVGSTDSFGNGGSDIYLIKTDANGNAQWSRTYGGVATDLGQAIHTSIDGLGYIIVGSTNSFGAGNFDIWMLRVDDGGNVVWDRTFGGTLDEFGYGLDVGCGPGYYIAGSTSSVDIDPPGDQDMWLIATGPDQEKPTLTVISPDGLETWQAGRTYTITWVYTGDPGPTVRISLERPANEDLWITQSTPTGMNGQGSFPWTIPSGEHQGFGYKVVVQSISHPRIADESDKYFSIVRSIKPWIDVHPIQDTFVGDTFTIDGSTNLAAGEILEITISSPSYPGISGSTVILPGTGDENSWSFDLDTSGFTPDTYSVVVEHVPTHLTGTEDFNLVGPFPNQNKPPSDPDGDGLFEDINTNGVIDYDDAVVLFWNIDWISENEPVSAFDFNGNGIMDYDDAVTLFWQI